MSVAFTIAMFLVVFKLHLVSSMGSHSNSAIADNSVTKKVGIVAIAVALIAGSAFSFSKAFADNADGANVQFSTVVNYDANYKVISIDYTCVNSSDINFTADFSSSWYALFGSYDMEKNINAQSTWTQTVCPEDLDIPDGYPEVIEENGGVYSFEGLAYLTYEAWSVTYDYNYTNCPTIHHDALNNTCDALPTFTLPQRDGYEFVEWNTAADGTGETVDAVYLASHPITSDVTFYAIWKEVTSGDNTDTPGADSGTENPDQPLNPSDGTDVTDPDPDSGTTEGDSNKDATSETDQNKDQSGDVDGKAEETSEN